MDEISYVSCNIEANEVANTSTLSAKVSKLDIFNEMCFKNLEYLRIHDKRQKKFGK